MLCYVEFIYVMWNLFTVGSLQFCNDSTIASLEANQNRPKIKYYINKKINKSKFYILCTLKFKTNSDSVFILNHENCISQVGRGLRNFCFGQNFVTMLNFFAQGPTDTTVFVTRQDKGA